MNDKESQIARIESLSARYKELNDRHRELKKSSEELVERANRISLSLLFILAITSITAIAHLYAIIRGVM